MPAADQTNTITAMSPHSATPVKPLASSEYMSTQTDMGNNKITVNVSGRATKTQASPTNPGPNPNALHPWEKCGLGVAPYKLIGSGEMTYQACRDAPVQPGANCDYCSQALMLVYFIRAACGSTFHVGCDCAHKVCDKREGVLTEIERKAREHSRKLNAKRTAVKTAAVQAELTELVSKFETVFRTLPHPKAGEREFFADKTYMDYIEFMLGCCGHKGRTALLKEVRAAAAAAS